MLGYYILNIPEGRGLIKQLMKVVGCWFLSGMPVILVSVNASNYVRALLWLLVFVVLLRVTKVIDDYEWSHFSMIFQKK